MAVPAQLWVEVLGEGLLRIGFKQGEEWMITDSGEREACITLHYPRQGEMMRLEGEPNETERKADLLNTELMLVNGQLKAWCS